MPEQLPSPDEPEPAHAVSREATADIVGEVLAWYRQEILAARCTASDPARLKQLLAEHDACVRDQDRLRDATAQETARIGALYAARLEQLKATGS
ncbi:hypothetical protein J2Z21_008910 [Streptomyces griseochromogenes]|uniref:Uncharacterized protein n=1 Tax=Streptomyces griseochromogenes TaxID=68214 RepID=A0ABS4M931_9ACTN|nr:hypothetical protein [Streptomyces griseochromogenes]MBP2055894.1 hypothetical protein [Streptomyces griseochromogenes]